MNPTWIFDLDNTLHDANPHVFPHINRAMTAYLVETLKLDEAAANQLREDYWRRYGATLSGLMRHHGTNPDHFLWHTHQFPNLAGMLVADPTLKHQLARLAGTKILFTNGPRHYAEAVLAGLGIARLFDGIVHLERVRFRPKPDPLGFRQIIHDFRLKPRDCIMVEDSLDNLRTAKRLGMRTVWLGPGVSLPAGVDWHIRRLAELHRLPGLARPGD